MSWTDYLRRFSPRDRSVVQAVLLEKGEQCSMCGTAPWQWDDDEEAYHAVTHVCLGCRARDIHRANSDDAGDTPGSSIRLVPRRVIERMRVSVKKRPKSAREKARERR